MLNIIDRIKCKWSEEDVRYEIGWMDGWLVGWLDFNMSDILSYSTQKSV